MGSTALARGAFMLSARGFNPEADSAPLIFTVGLKPCLIPCKPNMLNRLFPQGFIVVSEGYQPRSGGFVEEFVAYNK
jgi:hypothetical protein